MLLVRHDDLWLTASDLSDISGWTPALDVVCPMLDQVVQQAPGLRAAYQLPVARLNQTGTTRFKVARTFASPMEAETFAHLAASTFSPEGLAEFFVVNYAGEVVAAWTQSDAALIVAPQHDGGVLVLTEFTIHGAAPVVVTNLTDVLIGHNHMTPTFVFPGQLAAGQIGGGLQLRRAGYLTGYDISIATPADADITGAFVDGDGAGIGVAFTLPAGQRIINVTLGTEVLIAADGVIIPRLLTVGSAAAPGEGLQIIATIRQ